MEGRLVGVTLGSPAYDAPKVNWHKAGCLSTLL